MAITQQILITTLKSQFERIMEELDDQGKVRNYTDQENLEIAQRLNSGMDSFLHEQKINEKASELQLSSLVLNA